MVGTPRDMTLIIAGFFTQNLPAKAVELMSNGFLLGWCQLQELFTSSHAPERSAFFPFRFYPEWKVRFWQLGNIFEIFQKYFLDGGFWRIFRPRKSLFQCLNNDLGCTIFAVSSISEKIGNQISEAGGGRDSEDSPLKGQKAAPYTNKLCKGAAFLVGALRKRETARQLKAEPPCGFVGLAYSEMWSVFLSAFLRYSRSQRRSICTRMKP